MTHLNSRQKDTLVQLFSHPTTANLQWVDLLSLLGAVGSVEEKHDGRLRVEIGHETEVFERRGKDVSVEQIQDLRRMMRHHGLVEEFGIDDHHGVAPESGEESA